MPVLIVGDFCNAGPAETDGGFPCVSVDLEWAPRLFVVGCLASLQNGPDSANLIGIRLAARVVANALGCRQWLRQTNVLKNPLDVFEEDDDELATETSESEE